MDTLTKGENNMENTIVFLALIKARLKVHTDLLQREPKGFRKEPTRKELEHHAVIEELSSIEKLMVEILKQD